MARSIEAASRRLGAQGRDEARAGARPEDVVNVRRSAGKRPYEVAHPQVGRPWRSSSTRARVETPSRRCAGPARARTRAHGAVRAVRHPAQHKTVSKLRISPSSESTFAKVPPHLESPCVMDLVVHRCRVSRCALLRDALVAHLVAKAESAFLLGAVLLHDEGACGQGRASRQDPRSDPLGRALGRGRLRRDRRRRRRLAYATTRSRATACERRPSTAPRSRVGRRVCRRGSRRGSAFPSRRSGSHRRDRTAWREARRGASGGGRSRRVVKVPPHAREDRPGRSQNRPERP